MSHKDKSQRRKAIYSEEFQEMLDKLEEEDYVDRSGIMGTKKSRIEHEKVKALEKHFEEDNKLQPERKVKIAEEVGLEPRQVAIWFQNRRARWKTKHLEREYDHLRASYDSLKLDYGSLEQEKLALLNQLQDLKAKIDARSIQNNTSPSPSTVASMRSMNINNDNTSRIFPFSMSTASSSSMSNGFQVCKAYQEQLIRMDELGMLDNLSDASCNFFSSVDQAPSLHWQNGSNDFI